MFLKDRDCFNKVKILGQKTSTEAETKKTKKKNESVVKIAFTPDWDLDDYLRSKNLLEEKPDQKNEEPQSEEEKKEKDEKNIAALLSWNPGDEPIVDAMITESSESSLGLGLGCHGEMEMTKDGCKHDEKYLENNNNEMTESEIEAAYEDLCSEISQENTTADKSKEDSFWPISLQNKCGSVRKVDAEFSKIERGEVRKCNKTTEEVEEEEEFTQMEGTPSLPPEEWIGVVQEVRSLFLSSNYLKTKKETEMHFSYPFFVNIR